MKIYSSVTELIGNTPLVELKNMEKKYGLHARIFAKLEYFNPAGSVKDRVAKNMLEDAEKKGILKKGAVVIEPTSGNTGIGIAAICAAKGYRAIFTMPENMSVERIKLLCAYGAEVVLTEASKGMAGAIEKAHELQKSIEGSFICGQFTNPENPMAHVLTTGPEIWDDTDGTVDIFVAGAGTGGTVSGVGKFLKSKNSSIKVVAIEPEGSPVISGGKAGKHMLQGIGAGFIPETLDTAIIDEVFPVNDEDALNMARDIAKCEGILVGISSGAALYGAIEQAKREENKGKNIVVILPDTGERYITTPLFK